jgi:hypothetical protein
MLYTFSKEELLTEGRCDEKVLIEINDYNAYRWNNDRHFINHSRINEGFQEVEHEDQQKVIHVEDAD